MNDTDARLWHPWLRPWLLSVVLLTGCSASQGLIGPLPTVSDKDNAAEIIVIRESRFAGSMQTLPVTLDGVRIYGLGSGEHAVMAVNPGDHNRRDAVSRRNPTFLGGRQRLGPD